jgi:hypothetical protein
MTIIRNYIAICSIPLFGMTALTAVIQPPTANAAPPCPATMNFAVGGTGDPTGQFTPGVPPGPRTNVPYPATVDDNSQRIGRENLDRALRTYRAQCRNTHINVVSYSGGAQIGGDVRDSYEGDLVMRQNINFVLVSDPRSPNGLAAMLPSIPFWWTNKGPRPPSSIPTSYVCRLNDMVCNLGNPIENPIHAINTLIGWVQGSHNYAPGEIPARPGQHTPTSAPGPIPEVIRLPKKVPTPRQMSPVEPFVNGQVQEQWTPPAVKRGTAARNVGEIVPPALAGFVPPGIQAIRIG